MLRCTELDEDRLTRVRLERDPLGDIDLDHWSGIIVGGSPFNISDPAEASRFLTQAGFAATDEGITEVLDKGFDGWLERQFAIPQGRSRWDELLAQGYMNVDKKVGGNNALHPPLWKRRLRMAIRGSY